VRLRMASADEQPRDNEHIGPGTKALIMAILEGGIRDYCGATGRRRAEAEAWVLSDRHDAFSFAVVCEILGLDPAAVRQALMRLKRDGAHRLARSRQNVRSQKLTTASR